MTRIVDLRQHMAAKRADQGKIKSVLWQGHITFTAGPRQMQVPLLVIWDGNDQSVNVRMQWPHLPTPAEVTIPASLWWQISGLLRTFFPEPGLESETTTTEEDDSDAIG